MKLKKPDRFVRMVQRRFPNWQKFLKGDPMIGLGQAADLLRKEHAWMRRMVKSIQKMHIEHTDEWIVLDYVLKQLDQRRK